MWPNPQETANSVTFTEKILNGKLHFLCSEGKGSCTDLILTNRKYSFGNSCSFQTGALYNKWSFPLRISSINVTIPAVSCGFGHIYWRKISFFETWVSEQHHLIYTIPKTIFTKTQPKLIGSL